MCLTNDAVGARGRAGQQCANKHDAVNVVKITQWQRIRIAREQLIAGRVRGRGGGCC